MPTCKYCNTELKFDDCGDVDFYDGYYGDIVTHDFYTCPKCKKRYEVQKLYIFDEERIDKIDD